jgi:hypothetical protein
MLLGMSDEGPRSRRNWEFINEPTRAAGSAASQSRLNFRKAALPALIIIGVLGLAAGSYAYFKPKHAQPGKPGVLAASNGRQVSIPVYYPRNLPGGYTYNNDPKVLKANVLYFSVSGPGKQMFYVTQQPIPATFDFTAFNKKFLNPDNFSTGSGTVTAGQVGANMLASIRTDKNTWIIVNSSGTTPLTELEAVARSFGPAK